MADIIFDLIDQELNRQKQGIELIASENFTSQNVMKAMGSVLTNKYAEGLPNKRYYGGCEIFLDNYLSWFCPIWLCINEFDSWRS